MILKDRKLLARLMAIQHYSQRALARDSGFATHSYLGRMLAGTARTCTADRAVSIAACLQVPLDSLFTANVSSRETRSGARGDTTRRPFRRPTGSAAVGTSAAPGSAAATTVGASAEPVSA